MALGSNHSLLLGTEVQLVVSYTTIEAQVVFKMLITGQLAIVGQLGREVHLWRIQLFLGNRNEDSLEEDILVNKAAGDGFALF